MNLAAGAKVGVQPAVTQGAQQEDPRCEAVGTAKPVTSTLPSFCTATLARVVGQADRDDADAARQSWCPRRPACLARWRSAVCVADSVPAVPLTVTVVGRLCGAVGAACSFSAALAAPKPGPLRPRPIRLGQLLSGQLHGLGKAIVCPVDGDGGLIARRRWPVGRHAGETG